MRKRQAAWARRSPFTTPGNRKRQRRIQCTEEQVHEPTQQQLLKEALLSIENPTAPPRSTVLPGPPTVRELYESDMEVHCLFYPIMPITKDFWGRLYGDVESGYLESAVSHLNCYLNMHLICLQCD